MRLFAALSLSLVIAVLAACGGKTAATPTPPATPTPTPTPQVQPDTPTPEPTPSEPTPTAYPTPRMGDPADAPEELGSGVLARFQVGSEEFRLWTTNPETIDALFAIVNGEQPQAIPNGPLLEGPGPGDYNEPWSWRQHPEQTEMVEVTIELCDGSPSFVEEELDYWLETVGRYCPWSAHLVELTDLRQRGQ